MVSNQNDSELLEERNIIIRETFENYGDQNYIETNQTIIVDCYTSVTNLYEHICKINHFASSSLVKSACEKCSSERLEHRAYINTNFPLNLSNIQKDITDIISKKCLKCNQKEIIISNGLGPIIAFEPETEDKNNQIPLDCIQTNICVNGKKYSIHGVIEYTDHHFIAHVLRDKVWCVFDDISEHRKYSNIKRMVNASIVFFKQN